MKNNLFNRNPFKVSLLLLLSITFLFIHGCKKDDASLSDLELVQKAKEWFEAQANVSYFPNWGSAQVNRLGGKQLVVLPTNIKLYTNQTNIQSILVLNIGDIETKGNVVEIVSTDNITKENYIEISTNYVLNSEKSVFPKELDFNVLLFDIKHIFIKGDFISKGNYSSSIGLKTKGLTPEKLMGDRNSTMKEKTCDDYYYILRYSGGPIISTTYMFTVCAGGGGNNGASGGSGNGGTASKKVDVDPNARQCLKDIKAALEALGMKNTGSGTGLIASVLNSLN